MWIDYVLSILSCGLIMPQYSWNTAKFGIKHQSINQFIINRFYQWTVATQWTIINCDGCRYILIFYHHKISMSLVLFIFSSNARLVRRYITENSYFSSTKFTCDFSKISTGHYSRWNIHCTFSLLFNTSSCTHIKHIMKTLKKKNILLSDYSKGVIFFFLFWNWNDHKCHNPTISVNQDCCNTKLHEYV